MASEILAIPEEYLEEFIMVLQFGMQSIRMSTALRKRLERWIEEERDYIYGKGR